MNNLTITGAQNFNVQDNPGVQGMRELHFECVTSDGNKAAHITHQSGHPAGAVDQITHVRLFSRDTSVDWTTLLEHGRTDNAVILEYAKAFLKRIETEDVPLGEFKLPEA